MLVNAATASLGSCEDDRQNQSRKARSPRRPRPSRAGAGSDLRAWEIDDPAERAAMARKALKLSPDCADAYVLLAEAAHYTGEELLNSIAMGVAAGVAFTRPAFSSRTRPFLGPLETRPYMRARAGLALSLWSAVNTMRPSPIGATCCCLTPTTTRHSLCARRPPARTRPRSRTRRLS